MAGACAGRPRSVAEVARLAAVIMGTAKEGSSGSGGSNPTNGADQNDRPPDEVAFGLAAVEEASGDVTATGVVASLVYGSPTQM